MQSKTELPAPTDDDALLGLLESLGDSVPRALIEQAAACGTSMEDDLIAIIQDEECWIEDAQDPRYWLPLHAVMILGLRDSEAAGLALADALQNCTLMGSDLGDEFAGYWPALLRNKPDSVLSAFQSLFRTRAENEYCQIVSADVLLAAAQHQGPAALNAMLKQIAAIVADSSETLVFRQYMAMLLVDFPRAEYRKLVETMADVASDDGVMFAMSDVEEAFDEMQDAPEWEQFSNPWQFYSDEAIALRSEQSVEDLAEDPDGTLTDESIVEPIVREAAKIGRNNPCPCGSGKKYKKCCLKDDEAG